MNPLNCIFCGAEGKRSKEHIFPRWLSGHIRVEGNSTRHSVSRPLGFTRRGTQLHSRKAARLHRPGNPLNQTLRCVCGQCNNNWMSRLQTEAAPIILKFLQGDWPMLSADAEHTLARWVAMTTSVIEAADPETAQVSQEDRFMVMEGGVPVYWSIGIAPYTGSEHQGVFFHRSLTAVEPITAGMQLTSFALGPVLFHAISASDGRLAHELELEKYAEQHGLRSIWPEGTHIFSRKPSAFNDAEVSRLMSQFGEIEFVGDMYPDRVPPGRERQ